MRANRTRRRAVFGTVFGAALLAVALVVVPAVGDEDAVVLDAKAPTYGFSYGSNFDSVAAGSGCLISDIEGDLVSLSGAGKGYRGPGVVGTAIGIKTGGANGTPCSFVEAKPDEVLTVTSENGPWEKLDLDLELKDNAWVVVTLGGGSGHGDTFELVSGDSIENSGAALPTDTEVPYTATSIDSSPVSCANPSDSGPDSGANDNCYWTIDPGVTFSSFTISVKEGNVSLDGGGDDPSLSPTKFHYSQYAAADDTIDTDEDSSTDDYAVLANDDPASANFIGFDFGPIGAPEGLTDNGDGTFDFDPTTEQVYQSLADGDSTQLEFSYSAFVGTSTSSADVTINVAGVNDEPTPGAACEVGGDGGLVCDATTPEETEVSIDLADDIDEGDELTVECSDPANGTVETSGTDGVIDFTPGLDFVGDATFTCTVSDGFEDSTISVTVVVDVTNLNDRPVGTPDSFSMNDRDAGDPSLPASITENIVGNDTDVDLPAQTLTVEVDSIDDSGTLGSVSLDPDGVSFSYVADFSWPPGVFELEDSFTYLVTDGEDAALESTTVTVTVARVQCSAETVSDTDTSEFGTVFGSFTLLSSGVCKPYAVDADAPSQTVDFTPGGGTTVAFYGQLSGNAKGFNTNGLLETGLFYDPDLDGPAPDEVVPGCAGTSGDGPGFDVDLTDPVNTIDPADVSAVMPAGHSWCIARVTASSGGGGFVVLYELVGLEDPRFTIR